MRLRTSVLRDYPQDFSPFERAARKIGESYSKYNVVAVDALNNSPRCWPS